MAELTTDIGEEFIVDQLPDGTTITWTLYNDATDTITETDDLSAITTEPAGADYARQSSTVTTSQLSGNYGFDNDNLISFDPGESTQTVDHVAFIANFASTVAGDGGTATDHLIGVEPLPQSYDLSGYSSSEPFEFPSGNLTHTVD